MTAPIPMDLIERLKKLEADTLFLAKWSDSKTAQAEFAFEAETIALASLALSQAQGRIGELEEQIRVHSGPDRLGEEERHTGSELSGGWVVVPREPTEAMISACETALDEWRKTLGADDRIMRSRIQDGRMLISAAPREKHWIRWRAMISASPVADEQAASFRSRDELEARTQAAEADAAQWKADSAGEFLKRQAAEGLLKEAGEVVRGQLLVMRLAALKFDFSLDDSASTEAAVAFLLKLSPGEGGGSDVIPEPANLGPQEAIGGAEPSAADALLPCPFCGNTDLSIRTNSIGDYYVMCDSEYEGEEGCGAKTSDRSCETEAGAVRRWNSRWTAPAAPRPAEPVVRDELATREWMKRRNDTTRQGRKS